MTPRCDAAARLAVPTRGAQADWTLGAVLARFSSTPLRDSPICLDQHTRDSKTPSLFSGALRRASFTDALPFRGDTLCVVGAVSLFVSP